MTTPPVLDPARLEALYAAVEISKQNAAENQSSASQVVQDATEIFAFLRPQEASQASSS